MAGDDDATDEKKRKGGGGFICEQTKSRWRQQGYIIHFVHDIFYCWSDSRNVSTEILNKLLKTKLLNFIFIIKLIAQSSIIIFILFINSIKQVFFFFAILY